jgi:hypothetical protein
LEIPLARGRFDAFAAVTLLVYAVVFTAFVAAAFAFLHDTAQSVVLLVVAVLWLFWSALYLFTWSRMRRIDSPLALHGYGVFARSQFGDLTAPWETVQSVAVERAWTGRQLRIRLVPATDPRHAGIGHANLNPKRFEVVEREGMRYSLRILDIGIDELREAFVVQSGGRVRVA